MKPVHVSKAQFVAIVIASTSFFAGCNSSLSPMSIVAQRQSQRVHPQTSASTIVKIFNDENLTITGSAITPSCWTVSPNPIPTVAPNSHSSIITETYDTTCVSNEGIVLEYSLGSYVCDFTTTYGGSSFNFQATGTDGNCYASPSPSGANYDEKFTYGIILGLFKQAPHPHLSTILHK